MIQACDLPQLHALLQAASVDLSEQEGAALGMLLVTVPVHMALEC